MATGWTWVDPLAGLLVSAVIAWSAFGLFKSALHLSLDGVPEEHRQARGRGLAREAARCHDIHDLHIWPLSTTTTALTAHLVMPNGSPGDDFLDKLAHELEHRFGIAHATLQVERGDGTECRLAPASVV